MPSKPNRVVSLIFLYLAFEIGGWGVTQWEPQLQEAAFVYFNVLYKYDIFYVCHDMNKVEKHCWLSIYILVLKATANLFLIKVSIPITIKNDVMMPTTNGIKMPAITVWIQHRPAGFNQHNRQEKEILKKV